MRNISLLLGSLALAFGVFWYFFMGPRLTPRVWPGWTWQAQFIGTNNITWDATTDQFIGTDPININRRAMVAALDPQTQQLILTDTYATIDPATNVPTWAFVLSGPVDPQTGAHLTPAYQGSNFLFPRHVQKTTYTMRYTSYPGVPMAFVQEEQIEGLTTYLFVFKGSVNYGFSYASTPDYPGIDLAPGQEIKCWDDQLEAKAWVEPLTGEVVKASESCRAGDYIYDIATGQKIAGISRWAGEMAGDALIENVARIRVLRNQVLWLTLYIPALLVGLGGLGLGWGVWLGVRQPPRK